MGVISAVNTWRMNRAFKRTKGFELGSSILNGQFVLGDENILSSSDIYKYMQDISNMIACGRWVVEDDKGKDVADPVTLQILNHPNGYLTGFEFKKLFANVFLINGEDFIVKDGNQLHHIKGMMPEIDEYAIKKYSYNGFSLTNREVAHVKNIGLSHGYGYGLAEIAKDTIEGVMNAEKSITDKYKKGGLLAYLLQLDTHLSPKNTLQNIMVEGIQEKLSEIQDEGKTVIIPLSKGYKIEGFESVVDDEKVLKYLAAYKPDLAKFLGFDPDAYTKLIETDLEKAAIYLKAFVVDPIIINLCEHLSFLFYGTAPGKKISLVIDMKKYLTMSAKITNVSNLIRSMAYSPDDGRDDLGMERLNTEQSTQLYASKDLVGLDELSDLNKSKIKENEGGD